MGLNREAGMNCAPASSRARSLRGRAVWLGVTSSDGFTPGSTAWGRVRSPFRADSTAPYTVANTACSR